MGTICFIHHNTTVVLNISRRGQSPYVIVAEPLLDVDLMQLYGLNTAYGTAVQFEHVHAGTVLDVYVPTNPYH